MWKACEHKIPSDFYVEPADGGKNIWTCSHCKLEGEWTDHHSSYGLMECTPCGFPSVEWVACSDKCAKELKKPKRRKED